VGNETFRPGLGGVMVLISGLMALTTGFYSIQDPEMMMELYADVQLSMDRDTIMIFGAIQVIFGLVAIGGGLMAIWGAKYWGLATAGGILGTVAGGALFVGTLVGAIGLILVVSSRKEFRS